MNLSTNRFAGVAGCGVGVLSDADEAASGCGEQSSNEGGSRIRFVGRILVNGVTVTCDGSVAACGVDGMGDGAVDVGVEAFVFGDCPPAVETAVTSRARD